MDNVVQANDLVDISGLFLCRNFHILN